MSLNQNRYLAHRAAGLTRNSAAFEAGIPWAEAEAIDAAVERGEIAHSYNLHNPPASQDGQVIENATPSNPVTKSYVTTPAAGEAAFAEENDMARPKKAETPTSVEEQKPDFKRAVNIYRTDIKPAAGHVGEYAQEMSTAYKELKKVCHVQTAAAKLVFKLDDMEESKRDDWLRTFKGLCGELRIYMPSDLVDAAEGKEDEDREVVETGERRRPQLATVPKHPADDGDLAGGKAVKSLLDQAAE